MLLLPDGRSFSNAYTTYTYKTATVQETSPRIFLQVSIEGIDTEAFVDTGAPYVICRHQVAQALNLDPDYGERIENFELRGTRLNGRLYRLTVTILAEAGENMPVDATVFVPDLQPNQEWDRFPSILGLTSFLDRIRFAVDPAEDRFYFGCLDEDQLFDA
jgi:hypothetical protein